MPGRHAAIFETTHPEVGAGHRPLGPSPAAPSGRAETLRANLRALLDRGALDPAAAQRIEAALGDDSTIHPASPAAIIQAAEEQRRALASGGNEVRPPLIVAGLWNARFPAAVHTGVRDAERSGLFRRRILYIHEDEHALAKTLASPDLSEAIADPATEWYLGQGALEHTRNWLQARLDDALPKDALLTPGDARAARLGERVARLVQDAISRQQAAAAALRQELQRLCTGASPLDRRRALEEARLGRRSLRVLICGSIYTTFVKHSVDDLAAAFRSLGHDPLVLTEPDCSSRLTTLGYGRAATRHNPDLIVIVNYTRSMLGAALPEGVPCVCWIQDAMPQFFDERVGRAQTGLDMIAGNTMPELFTKYHYPQHAAMPFCVPASSTKFHAGPVQTGLRGTHECEIAFVSHHSEPPEAMRDRLARESQGGPKSGELLDRLFANATDLVDRAATEPVHDLAEPMCIDAFQAVYRATPSPTQLSTLIHSMLLPLAGRILRHQSLTWAAEIAERRGWRMRLHGNGWERVERLAPFAAGPIEHGEPLRASYAAARAHLHLDINTMTHQRVFECALSGGLPVARFTSDGLASLRHAAIDELLDTASPICTDPDGNREFRMTDAPLGARLNAERAALGLPTEDTVRVPPGVAPMGRFYRERIAPQFDAVRVLDGLADITFTDRGSLERLLHRAVEDDAWRRERAAQMRIGIEKYTTTEVFARRLIEHGARVVGWKELCEAEGIAWPPTTQKTREYREYIEDQMDA